MLHFDCVTPELEEALQNLTTLPELSDFALAGGTSLALRFGHRLSVDLDFFTILPFDSEELFQKLSTNNPQTELLNRAPNTLSLSINKVKVDILRHSYPLLSPIETFGTLRLLSEKDVAAMKLGALIGRGAKKDFYDLHELLQHHPLEDLLNFYEQKYPNTDRFLALRSLSYFADAEDEPDPVTRRKLNWPQVKTAIQQTIANF